MSQRLHIGPIDEFSQKDTCYDCAIDSPDGVRPIMEQGWLNLRVENGHLYFLGPWKIRVSDVALFRRIEPEMREMFASLGRDYPSCVWVFYCKNSSITHPSSAELDKWLAQMEASP